MNIENGYSQPREWAILPFADIIATLIAVLILALSQLTMLVRY